MKEMSDQTRGIIFAVLAVIIFMVSSHFLRPPPQKQVPNSQKQQAAQANAAATGASQTAAVGAATAASAAPAAVPAAAAAQASAETPVVVESSLYRVQL